MTFRRRKRVSSLFRGIWAPWRICISQLRRLPRRGRICKPEMKRLHPWGGSGFELQIKRNFQASDVGCRMRLYRFGDDFQGRTSQTPSPPAPASPGTFVFHLFPSKPSVTPSKTLPNSEPASSGA